MIFFLCTFFSGGAKRKSNRRFVRMGAIDVVLCCVVL